MIPRPTRSPRTDTLFPYRRSSDLQFGRLDIMHSNAAQTGAGGLNQDGDIVQMDADFWDQTMAINLRGSMLCAKHSIPHLLKSGGGTIIFTGSGKGLNGDQIGRAHV